MPTDRTTLAERIHLVATDTKREPCYLVANRGEGQTHDSFKDAFLSLTKQNKDFTSTFIRVHRRLSILSGLLTVLAPIRLHTLREPRALPTPLCYF
jgi:hypothetical protein